MYWLRPGLLGAPPATTYSLLATLPGAVYDAVLAVIIGPRAVAVMIVCMEQERVDWVNTVARWTEVALSACFSRFLVFGLADRN